MGVVFNNFEKHNDPEYIDMCLVYKNYIIEHVKNVNIAYNKLFKDVDYSERLPEEIDGNEWKAAVDQLETIIMDHDSSKWSVEEFEPYRRHFDPTNREKAEDKDNEEKAAEYNQYYEDAWHHHYTHNDHHPEFWKWTDEKDGKLVILDTPLETPRDMSLLSILHMICDWAGMSIKFRNTLSPIIWYNTQAKEEREAMSNNTKIRLKKILEMIFPDEEVVD